MFSGTEPRRNQAGAGEVGEMMAAYAAQAVEYARAMKIKLDFSEASIQSLEAMLQQLHGEMQGGAAAQPDGNQLDEMSRTCGGYIGEVVRRRFGGDWTIEKYPADEFLIVTLNVHGAKLFPSMKVHKRLTEGAAENVWDFYQAVRKKLEAMPGAKVQ